MKGEIFCRKGSTRLKYRDLLIKKAKADEQDEN